MKQHNSAKTMYDKIWEAHEIVKNSDGSSIIYIDRHFVHEVTSPQAFIGLKEKNRNVRCPDKTIATPDHNIPTINQEKGIDGIKDKLSVKQIKTLQNNCESYSIPYYGIGHERHGIVHVIAPENGFIEPGMTVVCGDSHTCTNGAFGALAHGIGTSEIEHVLATQCLVQRKLKNMKITVNGKLSKWVNAKDVILYIIGKIGTDGGTGHAIEFSGDAISEMDMEERMTLCNMAIEAGAKVGLVSVDNKTVEYLLGTPEITPKTKGKNIPELKNRWYSFNSDNGASYDKEYRFNAEDIKPQVTWGTSPEMVVAVDEKLPKMDESQNISRESMEKGYCYMKLEPEVDIKSIKIDRVFIGSCTNGRISDIRKVAEVVKGKKISSTIKSAIVVPGSQAVKKQAEFEGLDKVIIEAGLEWRDPGCSMCLAMNGDQLEKGERCASTSNRNFENRQGIGGMTHLVSPAMAAAAAIAGHFVDISQENMWS